MITAENRALSKLPKIELGVRVCISCGNEFIPWRRDQEFCQTTCARGKHAQTHRALYKHYGVGLSEYRQMAEVQGKKCAICNNVKDGFGPGGKLHVDHDHVTSKVRGLLCNNCNNGLGRFEDSPERLEKAAAYIRAHRQKVEN